MKGLNGAVLVDPKPGLAVDAPLHRVPALVAHSLADGFAAAGDALRAATRLELAEPVHPLSILVCKNTAEVSMRARSE